MPGGSRVLSHPAEHVPNCSMQYTSLPWSATAESDLPASPSRRSAAGLVAPPRLGRVGWLRRNVVPFRWLPNWGAISAIECLFWDQWETAVFGQILAGCSQKQPESSWKQWSNQKQPGAARSSQKHPGQEQLGPARSSQEQPGAGKSSQKQPKAARSSLPQEARDKEPGGPGSQRQRAKGGQEARDKEPGGARKPETKSQGCQEARDKKPGSQRQVPGFTVATFVIATSVRVITS